MGANSESLPAHAASTPHRSRSKIVVFTYSVLAGGGAERVTIQLCEGWAEAGHQVTLLTLTPVEAGEYECSRQVARASLDLAANSGNRVIGFFEGVRRVWAVRKMYRRLNPDVILAMFPQTSVIALIASIGLRVRVAISERVHPPAWPLPWHWERLRRLTYQRADVVVAQTRDTAVWLSDEYGLDNVHVIPNMLRWPLADGTPDLHPSDFLRDERKVVLAAGRMTMQKGFDTLLEAFSDVAARHANWDLVILGDGPLRQALQRQLAALDLEARVCLPGKVGNPSAWYGRADIFALSSRFEGFPNVLLEAMASGCAAVSFDCDTGPRDIISSGENGLLVPLSSGAHGLARALNELIEDASTRQKLASAGRSVRERFAVPRVLAQWNAILEV